MNRLKTQSPEDVLERVRSDVIEARDHFEIYRTYKHIRSRARYREVLHVYGFFSHSLRAHFAAIFAALGRVFNESEKSVGIQTLLNVAPHLRSVELRTQQRADKLWSTARHIRHQFVAHQYARSSVQETFKRADQSLNKIGELIGVCDKLTDKWSQALDCHVHQLSNAKVDVLHLLNALTRLKQIDEAR